MWHTVLVLDGAGRELHRATLYVPPEGAGVRCDQHPTEVDGKRCEQMQTATDIGALVRGWIYKRPSVALVAEIRRDTWREAARMSQGSPERAV